MAETIDDITITYEEGGETVVEELDKAILTKGSWTTILFKYRERDRSGEMGPEKFSIRRYQKRNGVFRQQSKFNISSVKQARQLIDALSTWTEGASDDGGDD
ncbi:MAG: hypothetical protein KC635_15920 [Myxococcales bacterium]|nr:hypothetical protein [Myxococcales bacterium]MCB9734546.1 hypothetical protein [Deltaproteobacteria bacterium]